MKSARNRDYDYFAYFTSCSKMALDAAEYLNKALNEFKLKSVGENVEAMHKIENDADKIKHEMLEHLAHEFMPPIEREDLVALAQQLDNVVDAVEEVMQRIYMYNIGKLRPDTLKLTSLIVRCCEALLKVLNEFPHFKKSKTIHSMIIEVNSIESEGDKLHAQCMRNLFTDGTEFNEIVVWMTMYDCLENCLDACEDAADIIESVIMKNT